MTATLERLHEQLSAHLDAVKRHFRTSVKVTLVIRQPEIPGDAGIVIGDDDYDAAIAEIQRQRVTGTLTGGITHNDEDDEIDDGADRSSENDPDFCYECQRDIDDCECDLDGPDDYDDDRERGCVLGKECLAPDPFHRSDECFDAEMAEHAFGLPPEPTPGPNGCTCGFNGDCNCRFVE